jgi:hypothetical protein
MKALPLIVLAFMCLGLCSAAYAQSDQNDLMQRDVERLVEAAKKRTTLWPWQGPEPEVAVVARYGKAAGPFLVALLDPDPDNSDNVDWQVQQQAALALCKIYGITDESSHVYDNRAFAQKNREVKRFWLATVAKR